MNKQEENECLETFMLVIHNIQQEKVFKSGGITFPKFESYESMKKFFELIKDLMPSTNAKFKDFSDNNSGEIVFDIPDKYR